MSLNHKLLMLIVLVSLLSFSTRAQDSLTVAVFEDQLPYFDLLLRDDDCPAIETASIGNNLMLAEYLLLCNLVKKHNPNAAFTLLGFPIVARVASAIESGDADISGFGIWSGEAAPFDVSVSSSIMEKGQFSKGLYTSEANREAFENNPETLKSGIAVSNRNWTYDWAALHCAGFKVLHVDTYEQMFQLVQINRANILPLGFGSAPTFRHSAFGMDFYPIEGLKLTIPDSSHFLVSKQVQQTTELLEAVNKGLAEFKQNGKLKEMQMKVGAIHPKTDNWRPICSAD